MTKAKAKTALKVEKDPNIPSETVVKLKKAAIVKETEFIHSSGNKSRVKGLSM